MIWQRLFLGDKCLAGCPGAGGVASAGGTGWGEWEGDRGDVDLGMDRVDGWGFGSGLGLWVL